MKNRRTEFLRGSRLILLISLVLTVAFAAVAQASPQFSMDCSSCHDMPPTDSKSPKATKKDPFTGAVPGNHETHAGKSGDTCVVCHGPAPVSNSHRNKVIELNDTLRYTRKVGGFLNQTSVPPVPLGTCSNISCHSDGRGNFKNPLTPAWGSAPFSSPADCGQCHGVAPNTGNHPYASNKHALYYGAGVESCSACHADHRSDARPFQHATSSRAIEVKFAKGGSFAGATCSALYCHSDGRGNSKSVSWGGSLPADCSGCHGNAATASTLSGKHDKHVNNAQLGGSYGCADCHATTVSDNSTVRSYGAHVDGMINYSGANAGKLAGGCSTVYCHSDGKGGMKTMGRYDWTAGAAVGCDGCHGSDPNPYFTSVAGEPNYQSGPAGSKMANSHKEHVKSAGAATCVYCHSKTTSNGTTLLGGTHTNGSIDVDPDATHSFTVGAGKTCSNISCHGGGVFISTKSAVWGDHLQCNGCHDDASTISSNAHQQHLTKNMTCQACHSSTAINNTTLTANPPHISNLVEVVGVGANAITYGGDKSCATACHLSATPVWNKPETGACGTCHQAYSNTINGLVSSAGHLAHFTKPYGPQLDSTSAASCSVCHTSESASTHADGTLNLVAGYSSNGTCNDCHRQVTNWASPSVSCESCHSTKGGALSIIKSTTAPDKTLDASKGHGFFGQGCTACHDSNARHITGLLGDDKRIIGGLTGNDECNSCHQNASKVTRTLNMQGHVGASTLCSACHDPHGTTNSYMVSTDFGGTAVSYSGTDFVNTSGTGICQVCHTQTSYYRKGVNETGHTTENCLNCHQHNTSSGTAFEPLRNCDSCHGYPPMPRNLAGVSFGFSGNWSGAKFEDYSGGGGAHAVDGHVPKTAKASEGWANCTMCHVDGAAAHNKAMPLKSHIENVNVKVDNQYRFSADSFIVYTGAKLVTGANKTGGCFNVNCHFRRSPQWSITK